MKRFVLFAFVAALLLTSATISFAADGVLDSDGVKIRYIDRGEGTPVVLIHGFSASIEANWLMSGLVRTLRQDYRVVALDVRGHGKSDKPHGKENYGTKTVDDVLRLMDHLEIDKAHIVGYSMGGLMTLKMLVHHPDRFISAVPGAAGWAPPDSPQLTFLDDLAESLEQGKGLGPLVNALWPDGDAKPTEEQIKAISDIIILQNDVLALAGAARGMAQLTVTQEQLEANTIPTLAIVGGADPIKTGVEAMAEVMANLEVVVVEGANHLSCFRTDTFRESLLEFLAKHSEPKPAKAIPASAQE